MNKSYVLRIGIASIVAVLSILAFGGIFYQIKVFDIQLVALLQRVLIDFSLFAFIFLLGLFLLTFLFGRFYCSTLCPLGILQEFLMFVFRRKNSLKKNLPYKYFIAALVLGFLIGGTAFLVRLIDPYTLFGSAMSGALYGLVVLFLIAVLVWFKGRWFCSNLCPVGTLLGLISKFAVNKIYIDADKCVSCGVCASKCPTGSIDYKQKTVDNETCVKCLNCLGKCPKSAISFGMHKNKNVPFSQSRRKFIIGGAAVGVLLLAAKGSVLLAKSAVEKFKKVIIPAGAKNLDDFANRCLNCNLCVQNCPMKIIKKADGDYPVVHIYYTYGFCDYDCHRCSEVCPSGAIERISLAEKRKTQIGVALVDESKCIKCGLCVMKCPRQIIKREDGGYSQISADECIGCGACQNACPVDAIAVVPVEKQKVL